LSTLKEPYRLEGKKTMGLELAEQLEWRMPDVLLYPTGGGTGLVGIPKGYEELVGMKWVSGAPPRFFAIQAEGCAPVVKAFHDKADNTSAWENPTTHAAGLRVPSPFAGRQMLKILRDSGGGAVAVSESEIQDAQRPACWCCRGSTRRTRSSSRESRGVDASVPTATAISAPSVAQGRTSSTPRSSRGVSPRCSSCGRRGRHPSSSSRGRISKDR